MISFRYSFKDLEKEMGTVTQLQIHWSPIDGSYTEALLIYLLQPSCMVVDPSILRGSFPGVNLTPYTLHMGIPYLDGMCTALDQ